MGFRRLFSKISEIATATVEQANNASSKSRRQSRESLVSRSQTAAGSEEMASSSEELGAQAGALKNLVSKFRTDNAGSVLACETVTK